MAADVFSGIPEDSLVPVRECYMEQDFQKTWNELPERLLVIVTLESNAERPGIFIEGLQPGPVHGVAKSRARLSNFTFTFHFHALEKEMATHSSILAWRIPGTMGSHRVGHN